MKYNLLGNTGLKVSELCLGTMTFGGRGMWTAIGTMPQDEVNQLVKTSVDAGINFIDTANIYSEGLSEKMTGQAIRDLGLNRDDLVIATKVRGAMGTGPNHSGLSRKHILQQADESLKRLNMDYVDLYQIHGFDPITPLEETLDALDSLVKSGKVRYIGLLEPGSLAHYEVIGDFGTATPCQIRFTSGLLHHCRSRFGARTGANVARPKNRVDGVEPVGWRFPEWKIQPECSNRRRPPA